MNASQFIDATMRRHDGRFLHGKRLVAKINKLKNEWKNIKSAKIVFDEENHTFFVEVHDTTFKKDGKITISEHAVLSTIKYGGDINSPLVQEISKLISDCMEVKND